MGTGVEKRWAGTPLLSRTAAVRLARLKQGGGQRSAAEVRGRKSEVMVQDSPPAGTATFHLAAGVEADDHAPAAEVIKAPGQVGVKSLKAAQLSEGVVRAESGRGGRDSPAWPG